SEERRRILVDWNRTDLPLPATQVMHRLIEQQVDRTPGAEAVVAADARLTYRELDRRANRLARHLRARGAGPGHIVGVCLPRTSELIVALLAVLKTGAAYVPLDPTYPLDRISFMLQDAQAKVLVTHAALDPLPDADVARVVLDHDGQTIARED